MDPYIQLAKDSVENYIKTGKIINVPDSLPEEFYSRRAGVFVTIYNGKNLRGCIGTSLPTKKTIAEEIIANAISACSKDYRFSSITEKELPQLRYEISILSEPVSLNDLQKHDPKKHGIIAQCTDGRAGLLLPDLEGVNSTEDQLNIACQKGDINVMRDAINLYEFTIEKHA